MRRSAFTSLRSSLYSVAAAQSGLRALLTSRAVASALLVDAAEASSLLAGSGAWRGQAAPPWAAGPSAGQQSRGYAQIKGPSGAYATPALSARPMNIRLTMVSSNLIAEPYKGPPAKQPLTAWLTPSGWRERWRRWMSGVKSIYTVSKCKKLMPGWTLPGFKAEALAVHAEVCALLAAGDRTGLRQLVTPAVFSDMKRQLRQREDGGWARVDWSLAAPVALADAEVCHGRLILADPKDDNTGFAQLTVRIPSRQRFAAYDRRGRLVAGNPATLLDIQDFWVFERPLRKQASNRWRLAGRLTVPAPGDAAAAAAAPAAAAVTAAG